MSVGLLDRSILNKLVLACSCHFVDRVKGEEISINLHSSPLVPMFATSDFLFKHQTSCIIKLGIF